MRRLIAFVLCLIPVCAVCAETLRIGVFLHSAVVMQDKNGEPYGPSVEYAKSVALALGYEPKIDLLPIARILSYLSSGDLDMALEFGMNEDRKSFVLYPDNPCFVTHQSLTVRSDSPLTAITTVKDLSGMHIGYLLGAYSGTFFEGAADVTFDNVTGETWIAQNLSKLLAGRIDAILDQNEYSCLAEARLQGVGQKIRVLLFPGNGVKGYVLISRARPNAARLLRAYNALNNAPSRKDVNSFILESLR